MAAQIGCGNSFLASENRGPAQQDITVDMFVEELVAVKQALGLREHHVLGHGASQTPCSVLDTFMSITQASSQPCLQLDGLPSCV